ncbi:hypothetical protein JOF56_009242 [Kibdelosporangium banguiense]|uniref:DUF742 domain-containing protein n=1 Tax=Kibdelosporangium banguiense TaxID=1365924 RepID=A0ABS4TWS9_9PSEU|nr:DUF742 domain-containing protein [Kibdelosporangium banguiense]MBP2328857.1 hypothetical protein [Kibdelosporangium banguiense]
MTNPRRRDEALVRPYVVTDGRGTPSRDDFHHITLISAVRNNFDGLTPEKARLVRLCLGGLLSVAEVAAHLALPVGVTKVLLGDLVDTGHITTTSPRARTAPPTREVLEEVLHALQRL